MKAMIATLIFTLLIVFSGVANASSSTWEAGKWDVFKTADVWTDNIRHTAHLSSSSGEKAIMTFECSERGRFNIGIVVDAIIWDDSRDFRIRIGESETIPSRFHAVLGERRNIGFLNYAQSESLMTLIATNPSTRLVFGIFARRTDLVSVFNLDGYKTHLKEMLEACNLDALLRLPE